MEMEVMRLSGYLIKQQWFLVGPAAAGYNFRKALRSDDTALHYV
jgi:hypothetical protein